MCPRALLRQRSIALVLRSATPGGGRPGRDVERVSSYARYRGPTCRTPRDLARTRTSAAAGRREGGALPGELPHEAVLARAPRGGRGGHGARRVLGRVRAAAPRARQSVKEATGTGARAPAIILSGARACRIAGDGALQEVGGGDLALGLSLDG